MKEGVFTRDGRATAPVAVARVLRNAVRFNFGPRANAERFVDAETIPDEVQTLFDLLDARRLPYLLVGGLATLTHVHGRNTEEVSLVEGGRRKEGRGSRAEGRPGAMQPRRGDHPSSRG